jgi:hypothetical protein
MAATQPRLRPILLTTATTVASLIPLYLGGGVMWESSASCCFATRSSSSRPSGTSTATVVTVYQTLAPPNSEVPGGSARSGSARSGGSGLVWT